MYGNGENTCTATTNSAKGNLNRSRLCERRSVRGLGIISLQSYAKFYKSATPYLQYDLLQALQLVLLENKLRHLQYRAKNNELGVFG